ncbi:hypothetical protein BDW68DRAFT_94596 [Aspergillus falconensis]
MPQVDSNAIRLDYCTICTPHSTALIFALMHSEIHFPVRRKMDSILSAHEIGEGFPVLIIHGWQMEGRVEELDLEPIFSKTPGLRRIYVDLPGMGTTPANNVKDLDEIYRRLVHFIDSRLGRSRFLVAGSSCGGYLARAIVQKYIEQVDGLLLRVPLIEPEDSKRDLDAFKPLIANEQLMSSMSAEDRTLLGNVLIQTPAYVKTLKAKYEEVIFPAEIAADKTVLDPIREDWLYVVGTTMSWAIEIAFACWSSIHDQHLLFWTAVHIAFLSMGLRRVFLKLLFAIG